MARRVVLLKGAITHVQAISTMLATMLGPQSLRYLVVFIMPRTGTILPTPQV